MDSIRGGPVASVNGHVGPLVTLAPADLGMVPNTPAQGASAGTLRYDAQGRLVSATQTLEGKPCEFQLRWAADGALASASVTYDHWRRDVALTYTNDQLTSFTGAVTRV